MDVMKDFARLLPFQVVAQMIGLPSEMFPAIQSWARLLTRFVVSFTSLEDLLLLDVASGEFADYLRTIIADRRVAPKKDLISSLIEDKGAQGQVLTEQELLSICIFVVVAGLEAVENFLGNSALALITHPNEWQRFRERGGNWTTAIDELLRFDAPLQLVLRKALEDVELGGKIIRAGEYVYLALGSANRDSARFERADELLLDRQQNHHLSFGDGHHLCVGAQLSRIEGHESLQVLMEMIPDMRPATDKLTWGRSLLAHGLKALPVKFTAQRDSNYAAVN
jgi:cytochrome P450